MLEHAASDHPRRQSVVESLRAVLFGTARNRCRAGRGAACRVYPLPGGTRLDVITLPAERDLPDSVFVEDPAVVVDEVAVITRMGAESRRRESESLAGALAQFRPLHWMTAPATLEGGDIIRAGRTLFAGVSQRTNAEGIAQLAAAVAPFGYEVRPVEVRGCLHLKSGACYLGRETILANREWIDADVFRDFRILDVAEPWACRCPRTRRCRADAGGIP